MRNRRTNTARSIKKKPRLNPRKDRNTERSALRRLQVRAREMDRSAEA